MKAFFTKLRLWNDKTRRWLGVPLDSMVVFLAVILAFAIKADNFGPFFAFMVVFGVFCLVHFIIFLWRKR